jgi:hypothetical protein
VDRQRHHQVLKLFLDTGVNTMRSLLRFVLSLTTLALAACAAKPPEIRTLPPPPPQLDQCPEEGWDYPDNFI